jgi:hypothetical protein
MALQALLSPIRWLATVTTRRFRHLAPHGDVVMYFQGALEFALHFLALTARSDAFAQKQDKEALSSCRREPRPLWKKLKVLVKGRIPGLEAERSWDLRDPSVGFRPHPL